MFFLLLVSVLFLLTVTELSIRGTQVIIWIIMTKEIDVAGKASYKLSILTSLPSFCRHIIPILNFISIENIFGCYFFC